MDSAVAVRSPREAVSDAWKLTALTTGSLILASLALYWNTVASILHQWATSGAYSYGYAIPPIAAFLVWRDRPNLRARTPTVGWLGLAFCGACGLAWLAAEFLTIDEGRHFAYVGMLIGLLIFGLGASVARYLAFSLAYLWLMVPTGDFLLTPLQRLARDGAVFLLQISNIPHFVEGFSIDVPTGSFVVEPGCSGLNFVLASLALSLLFGKMNYRGWLARTITVAISLVVAVLANMVRIFLIIAIGYWTNRRIDISADHLLYGWLFFGVVMLVCMWIGVRFADIPETEASPMPQVPAVPVRARRHRYIAAFCGLLLLAAFPAIAHLTASRGSSTHSPLALPSALGTWTEADLSGSGREWTPGLVSDDTSVHKHYVHAGQGVDLWVAYYDAQRFGHDATSSLNMPAPPDSAWTILTTGSTKMAVGSKQALVTQAQVKSALERRIVVYWYESGDCITASRLRAKICTAKTRLLGHRAPGAFVAVSTTVETETDSAGARDAIADLLRNWPGSAALVGRENG